LQQIKVQGLACKIRRNTGVQLQFTRGLITRFQNFSDQIENGYSHHTNGAVVLEFVNRLLRLPPQEPLLE
jgi:hypothetical protein